MCATIASAIRLSFCGTLNTQRFVASIGWMMEAEAESEIIGTLVSAATLIMASEAGVVEVPMMMSAFSSSISLRMLATALVLSAPSSSTV